MEISNQKVLFEILLKFQEDLKNGRSNPCEKYAIEFKYILPLETAIIELMCVSAAGLLET